MLFALLLATLTPMPAQQSTDSPSPTLSRWEPVGGDERGQYSIDPQTITRDGSRVRVFVRLQLKGDDQGPSILGVMRYVHDCKAHTARVEQIDVFSDDGTLLQSNPTATAELVDEPIKDGTPNDNVFKRVCR